MKKNIKLKKIKIKNYSKKKQKEIFKRAKLFNKIKEGLNITHVIILIITIAVLTIMVAYLNNNNKYKYIVNKGKIEYNQIVSSCYIIKEETIIKKDDKKILLPIISDFSRVAKGEIIAIYKGSEYENYEEKLLELDNKILLAMKELPVVYSNEIESIEKQISNELLNSKGESSYVKMQNTKKTINSYLNKKATVVASLSPQGAIIRTLIKERNEYEKTAKSSNDNVLAVTSGIVSYTTDGLEDLIKVKDINNLNYEKLKQLVDAHDSKKNSDMKIMNNYIAYVVMKVSNKYEADIEQGDYYNLRLISENNYEYSAKLVKALPDDSNNIELVFELDNGIEKLLDIRKTEFEVVFNKKEGLIVPKKAIKQDIENDYMYVTAIRYREYVKLPIHILTNNDDYAIVSSYTEDELNQMNISKKNILRLYENILGEVK